MRKELLLAERLIVAADFKPTTGEVDPIGWVGNQVRKLADDLEGTGVYIKLNSALRACGYRIINEIHNRGLKVFADLKLIDISETLSTDGDIIRDVNPELLTVMCVAGSSAIKALKNELPDTEVLGVTVLTSLKDEDTEQIFRATVEASAMKLALLVEPSGVDGYVCAGTEITGIKSVINRSVTYNAPAIRPKWAFVAGDDQNKKRAMTPAEAIAAGADRIVVGRPIIRANNPKDAVKRTLEEIATAIT